jgi:hypothetical protein
MTLTPETKNKILYWTFKVLAVIVSCLLPIWAICEKFPIWTQGHGTEKSIGVGAILTLIVVTIIFRKAVFKFLSDKCKLDHAPPIVIWLVLIIISYVMIYIGSFLSDLTIVFWMGMIGCAVGTVLTYIAENRFGGEEKDAE